MWWDLLAVDISLAQSNYMYSSCNADCLYSYIYIYIYIMIRIKFINIIILIIVLVYQQVKNVVKVRDSL